MSSTQKAQKAYPISAYLFLIVLVAVLPVLFFSAHLSNRLIQTEHEFAERYLVKTADELALAFDQEIMATARVLEALGQVESLRRHELSRFHKNLQRALKTQTTWTNIVLHNARMDGLMAARDPYGAPFGNVLDAESIQTAVRTRKPTVGKIVNVTGKTNLASPFPFRFSVRVPVEGESGKIEYVLSAIISTDHLQEIVNRFSFTPNELTRALIDPDGIVGARSTSPEKYVGGLASQTLRQVLAVKDHGFERTTTLDGVEAYTSFRRAPFSGWSAAIAVPLAVLQTRAQQTTRQISMIAFVILAFVILACAFFSRWIKRPIVEGSESAALLSRGEVPTMGPSRISELENMRQSLLSASDLLRSRNRAKDEFLANMSHELRTPLGIVVGMTELLSNGVVTPEEREKNWEVVRRNSQHLLRLVDDILDLSKIEAHKLNIEYVEFSLPDLISSIAEDFTLLAREKGLKLRVRLEDGSAQIINTDVVRIQQIVSNLVGNAVKFTHQGSIEISLFRSVSNLHRITVTDTGIGLTEEQKSLLFKEFTQVDSSHTRKYGGTGLGLSLSQKLARLMGGDVKLVKSESGQGSTFEVTFKSKALSSLAMESPQSKEPKPIQSSDPKKVKILLAEDSADNVLLIQTYLKKSGYEVQVATTGLEALELIDQSFDLILMDIQMPGMDGHEATREIRKRQFTTPIIALTAHALQQHRQSAIENGFTDFVTKPIRRTTLLEVIAKYTSTEDAP